ncbi:MAG: GNAT family N-acetyltransferase [Candidatus Hadarchaeum sp.]
MIFRADPNGKVPKADGRERKHAMRELVRAGTPVGLLGYSDGVPVAWCSLGPGETFPGLAVVGEQSDPVWSVTCFYIQPEFQRSGVTRALLKAAIAEARKAGAKALEAYPIDPDSPSYRFGGFVPFFGREGFHEMGRLGSRRHIMRLDLDAEKSSARRTSRLTTGSRQRRR